MGRLRPCIVLSCNYAIKQLQKLLSDAVRMQRKCLPVEPDHIRAKDLKLPFDQLCLVHTWFEKVPPGMDLVGLHMWLLLLAFCHEERPEPERQSHRSKTLVCNPSIIMAIKNRIMKFVPHLIWKCSVGHGCGRAAASGLLSGTKAGAGKALSRIAAAFSPSRRPHPGLVSS